ncbi:MAG TPA: hypothetical protein VH084_28385 [Mycobacterium sp.]|jgi:hypothetical protein|nr:hypothetical protein [Mycobacterium sp.]
MTVFSAITWFFILVTWQINFINLALGSITQAEFAASMGDMEAIFINLRRARRLRRFGWPWVRLVPYLRERLYPPRVEAKKW